jgi:hypothetical protein
MAPFEPNQPPQSAADFAREVARLMREHASEALVSRDDVQHIAEVAADKATKRLMDRLGIDEEELAKERLDRMWVRRRREVEEAVVKQGIGAVVLALLAGVGTAVAFWIKSGAPGGPK